MKWVLIGRLHINTSNVSAFKWEDGRLYIFFPGDPVPYTRRDPDKKLYYKVCRSQGLRVYDPIRDEEETND